MRIKIGVLGLKVSELKYMHFDFEIVLFQLKGKTRMDTIFMKLKHVFSLCVQSPKMEPNVFLNLCGRQ